MTISITLNNVHTTHNTLYNPNNSNCMNTHQSTMSMGGYNTATPSSSSFKARPHRKLQQYHSSSISSIGIDRDSSTYRSQILPNGYEVLPMLTLHDIAVMKYTQQQQQQQQIAYNINHHNQYHHHHGTNSFTPSSEPRLPPQIASNRVSSYANVHRNNNNNSISINQNDASSMKFPSLIPTVTTVLPSSSSSSQYDMQISAVYNHHGLISDAESSSSVSSSSSSSPGSTNSKKSVSSMIMSCLRDTEAPTTTSASSLYQQQKLLLQGMTETSKSIKKKCVRFVPTVTVYTRSVTDEDLYQSWYQPEQYLQFESDNRQIVSHVIDTLKVCCKTNDLSKISVKVLNKQLQRIIHNGSTTGSTNKSNRIVRKKNNNIKNNKNDDDRNTTSLQYKVLGLEQFLYGPKYMHERRRETIQHGLMVLEMYDVQRTMQHYNPDVVRRVSERFSYPIVERAVQRALSSIQQQQSATAA